VFIFNVFFSSDASGAYSPVNYCKEIFPIEYECTKDDEDTEGPSEKSPTNQKQPGYYLYDNDEITSKFSQYLNDFFAPFAKNRYNSIIVPEEKTLL